MSTLSMAEVHDGAANYDSIDDDHVSSSDDGLPDVPEDDGGKTESGGVIGMTFNTITNVIGGGVLNLPTAMYEASIAVGTVLCVFSSLCSTFSVYTLVKACDFYERYSMMDIWAFALFPQANRYDIQAAIEKKREQIAANSEEDPELDAFIAKEAHNAKWRRLMVDLMIVIIFCYNFGCLVLYGVVIGDSLPPVVQNFFHGDGIWIDKGTWLIAGGAVFFVLSCARKMSELKWSSVLGFVTILYVIILVIVRYFTIKADPSTMPAFNDPQEVTEVKYFEFNVQFANAMTTLGLAYCYHYNVPYFYKELKDRTASRMMLTAAYSQPVTFISYLSTGIFGYLTFGKAVDNSKSGGNIVGNFADDDVAVNIGRFGLFFHFCCVYPILAVSCRRGLHHVLEEHLFSWWRRAHHVRLHTNSPRASFRRSSSAANVRRSLAQRASQSAGRVGSSDVRYSLATRTRIDANLLHLRCLETPVVLEDPSLKLIVLEAFVIVASSILCAWVAPGIKLVVNITGSLFGLFLMFVAPGIIGVRMFGLTRNNDFEGKFEPSRENKKYWTSWLLVVVGAIMIVASFYTIVS